MEKQPLVTICFSFGHHGSEDIAYLPAIKRQAEILFEKDPRVKNVYISENLCGQEAVVLEIRRRTQMGQSFIDAFSQTIFSLTVEPKELSYIELAHARRTLLARDPNIKLSDVEQVQWNGMRFAVNELLMLDALKQSRVFDYDSESYPQAAAMRNYQRSQEELSEFDRALSAIKTGQVEEATNRTRNALDIGADLLRRRNPAWIDKLTAYVSEADETGQKTRMLVRVGETHDVLIKQLREALAKLTLDAEITYVYDHGEPLPRTLRSLHQLLETNPGVFVPRNQLLAVMLEAYMDDFLKGIKGKTKKERWQLSNTIFSGMSEEQMVALVESFPRRGFYWTLEQLLNPIIP